MAFDQAIADAICARMEEGLSLRKACKAKGAKMPTFLLWVSERKELADQYARARNLGRALRFEALRELTNAEPERDANGRVDPGWVQWRRLHVDTEKWSLAKEEPKVYGDKVQQEHSGTVTLQSTPTDEAI